MLASFRQFGVLSESVHLVKGLFESSVPAFGSPPRPISVLRLDGDLYSSTKVCVSPCVCSCVCVSHAHAGALP